MPSVIRFMILGMFTFSLVIACVLSFIALGHYISKATGRKVTACFAVGALLILSLGWSQLLGSYMAHLITGFIAGLL
jgi:hypothetical protein